MQTDEERLVESAIGGDAYAFEQLMGKHEARMYAVALRMCGNREDAQDCLQEAMLRVYRAISNFKGQSTFSTWVYRITMNTCLDELRRKKNRPNTSLDNLLDQGWSPSDGDNVPERRAIQSETRKTLAGAIRAARGHALCHRTAGRAGLLLRRDRTDARRERGNHQIPDQPGTREIARKIVQKSGTF